LCRRRCKPNGAPKQAHHALCHGQREPMQHR
jgi:hypothetical protein